MNKNLYIEAYRFYKEQNANSLVLFHINSNIEVYEEDAEHLNHVLNLPVLTKHDIRCCLFPYHELTEKFQKLVQNGAAVSVVEYRNEQGEHTIPKVKQILEDIDADY